MKFLADMGVSPRCAEWLRTLGHDAIHLYEQGLHKSSDDEILCKANDEI
jgi:predicted nuclease of predicted toxin-antitoxin system